MKRSAQRETLMQMMYQMGVQRDFSDSAKDAFYTSFIDKAQELDYLEAIYPLAAMNIESIDDMIRSNSDNWKLERIAKVDLAILRLAITEILYADETPNKVAINEAVELGKKYGTDDSGKFINGVLGKIIRNISTQEKTAKNTDDADEQTHEITDGQMPIDFDPENLNRQKEDE